MKKFSYLLISVIFFKLSLSLYGDSGDIYDAKMKELYDTDKQSFKDITQKVLNSGYTSQNVKNEIIENHRRIFSFLYPSDGIKVKGFISFSQSGPKCHPLLFLFRGGNRNFALLNPGDKLANHGDYTVVATTLRGGISEGVDEFGGADVDDNKNLFNYLPVLEKTFHLTTCPHKTYMIGPSRGGMEMFLTLARYPRIQNQVDKVVSLSGLLDMPLMVQEREGMRTMFIEDFGYKPRKNDQSWVKIRNPIESLAYIRKSLPVLVIQGTQDNRISLNQGYHFLEKMTEEGGHPTYWEVKGGDHTLQNKPEVSNQIFKWLEY